MTTEELPYADGLDLCEQWGAFPHIQGRRMTQHRADFLDHLRGMVCNPDAIDAIEFCGNCLMPAWEFDIRSAQGGDVHVCPDCWEDWEDCADCEERYPPDVLTGTLNEELICQGCLQAHYTWCDDCEGYYHDDNSEDHDHESSDCCESPQSEFMIRNSGCEPLKNDTRVKVALPSGTISAEGITQIISYLRVHGTYITYSDVTDGLGDKWQTSLGNFTKRLSRYAYQAYQVKLTPEVLSKVGCIARDHSTEVSVDVQVTRELNRSAAYFYHEDSCWWGSYAESRCALKTNGGFGLLSYNDYGVSGRAWVIPLRQNLLGQMAATFDTMTPDAFVVFNGYGDLSGFVGARIMAHLTGWTYRKIELGVPVMWINAGGYLVATEDVAGKCPGWLNLNLSQHSDLYSREQVTKETANVA